ncbi:MAG: tryptophan synthase subunit alpha [Patescibacteria group bacterium]
MKIMTHVVIGYPSLEETEKIVKTMAKSGVDMIELQIPFSDPLADGPTIMNACEKSLENGTKVNDAFIIMKKLSLEVKVPLLFMSYYNTVFKYGTEKFCRDAKSAGAYGLIVPDMPIDEESQEHFYEYCNKYDLNNIQVVSPASTNERLIKNAGIARGFIYFTARQGITGAKEELDPKLINQLKNVRKFFKIPLAVGFGISKKKHLEKLAPYADIAVVGSAIIEVINQSNKKNVEKNIKQFINQLV